MIFSEIMYDAEGGDTHHEWIEIQNSGTIPINIYGYKLKEGTTNHSLVIVKGTTTIPALGFAIIAESPQTFASDYPDFSGTLFDSAFSLSNTGETLVLKDAKLNDVDSISYTSDKGASGNGQTLQKIDGVWTVGNPTPGEPNVYAPLPLKEATLAVSKKSISKSTSPSSATKLSASKTQKALDAPADSQNSVSGAVDLSTFDQAESPHDAWKWYLGLGTLVLVAIGGIFALRLHAGSSKKEYEIIE